MKKKFLQLLVLFLVLGSTFFGFSGQSYAWTIDKTEMRIGAVLTPAEQQKFDIFQNAVNQNQHPINAAKTAGDTDYKNLKGDQYQIRLSAKNRATFLVDNTRQVVKMLQLGGHT